MELFYFFYCINLPYFSYKTFAHSQTQEQRADLGDESGEIIKITKQ